MVASLANSRPLRKAEVISSKVTIELWEAAEHIDHRDQFLLALINKSYQIRKREKFQTN